MRELYDTLRPKEVRLLHWSAAGAAASLWFSLAWRDAWVLLLVPMIAGWFVCSVYRNRRLDPLRHDEADDDPDFL